MWIYTYKVLKYTNVLLKNFFPIPASAQNGKVGGDVFLLSHIALEERCKAVQWTKRSIEQAVAGRAKAVVLHCGRIEMDSEVACGIHKAKSGQAFIFFAR